MYTNTSISTSADLTISAKGDAQLSASLTTEGIGTKSLNASLSILVSSHARLSQLGIEYAQTAGASSVARLAQLAIEFAQSNQTVRARVAQLAVEYAQAVTWTLAITPANVTSNGYVPLTFHARLTGSNGTVIANPSGTWSISGDVGSIDATTGVFTPNGSLGTVVVTFTTSEF
jgi:hypothetical protein